MDKKNKLYKKSKYFSSIKLSLSYEIILLGILDNYEPFTKLLFNFEEVEKIREKKEKNIFKYFYFNREKIKKIIYDEEEILDVNFVEMEKRLSSYFYLSLLIKYNPDYNDYTYSMDFIKQINNLQKNNNDKIYKKLIISKIILELVDNYKGTDNYMEKEDNDLNEIKKYNEDIIEQNIYTLNKEIGSKIDKENLKDKKVDEIYSEIIRCLIISKKFDEYNYIYNAINELDLENINITKIMLDEISTTLNNKNFTNSYIISNINDLNDTTKINFYYILLKYILKNPIYIYQINFLYNTKKELLKIVKTSDKVYNLLNDENDSDIKERIIYIINIFSDNEFYNEKYKNNKNNKNNSELNQISETNPSSKNPLEGSTYQNIKSSYKDDSILKQSYTNNDNLIEKKKIYDDIVYRILNKSSFTYDINEKGEGKFIINDVIKIKDKTIEYKDLTKLYLPENENNEKSKKSYDKFLTFFKDFEQSYKNNIKENYNLKIILEFNKEKDNDNNYYNITAYYSLYINSKLIDKFKTENILNNKDLLINDNGFQFLLTEINEFKNNNNINIKNKKSINSNTSFEQAIKNEIINSEKNEDKTKTNSESSQNNNLPKVDIYLKKEINNLLTKKSRYQIIHLNSIIGIHKKEAEFIIETKKGDLVSCGSHGDIILYTLSNNQSYEIKNKIEMTYIKEENDKETKKIITTIESMKVLNIYENKNELIVCSKEGLATMDMDFTNINHKIKNASYSFYLKMNNDNYIMGGEKGIEHYSPFDTKIEIIKNAFRGGIQIDQNTFSFSSNSTLPNGKDKLIFYNMNSNIVQETKKEYSFTISINSLALMDTNEENDTKILLCGCKKYKKKQNNGILLVDLETYNEQFYQTNDFEVYCFCPISIIINNYNEERNKTKNFQTNYFLVGGFEQSKRMGSIKLYKKVTNKGKNTTLEFIQDIIFKNKNIKLFKSTNYFSGFDRNISCMIQSKITGKLIITSWDGFVYESEPPNIGYYLNDDIMEKEG